MNYFALRRQTLARYLKASDQGLEAALVTSPINVTYLTGFTGEASYLIVTPKQSVLISDSRFEAQIREECADAGRAGELELHIRPHTQVIEQSAADVIAQLGVKNVTVEGTRIAVSELETIKQFASKATFVPQSGVVETLRSVKDMGEVEKIREAVRVAERAYKMFTATLAPTDTEKEMVDALDGYLRRAGARGAAFPTIVGVGERGALPHAPPTSRRLEESSKLLIDWGADLVYKSDITRVIRSPFITTPTRKNKQERTAYSLDEVYEIVLAAQDAAFAEIRPGAKCSDVDAAARRVISNAKLKNDPKLKLADCFHHGLGHGIGLEIHEAPRVRANSNDVLEAGMVITIEPGIYLPGWGGVRLEDDVLVTRDGYTLLTSLPRDLPPKG
jgi:Xaa-Pro aminopeptidase